MIQTKIIATIGPQTAEATMLKKLVEAGTNVLRMNCAHGDYAFYNHIISYGRQLSPLPLFLMDLEGPKLRLGNLEGDVICKLGEQVWFQANSQVSLPASAAADHTLLFPYPELLQQLYDASALGQKVFIDDGRVALVIESLFPQAFSARILRDGKLSAHKGVNLPGIVVPLPLLSDKDHRNLQWALSHQVDWMGLSFVQRAEDIQRVRALTGDRCQLVAKIETAAAMDDLNNIAKEADILMVARGDLGVEIGFENLPFAQIQILKAGHDYNKLVIVATQMLESMTEAPFPTRAEVTDVAGAIYQGAKAVMLSDETSFGKYPVEAVKMMAAVVQRAEETKFAVRKIYQGLGEAN